MTNEKLLRDLYLRDLHLGKLLGPMTGNMYTDKAWVTNFVLRSGYDFNIYETLYNTYKNHALQHLDEVAVYVGGKKEKYTHRELLDLIDRASAGLVQLGINENSKVGVMLNTTVEDIISFLALNKIGALSKWVDHYKTIDEIKHSIEYTNLDLLIMDSAMLDKNSMINIHNIPVVVANGEKVPEEENIMLFQDLYRLGDSINLEAQPYVSNKNTVTIHSSGSSGPSKPINHSDDTINAAAQKVVCTDYPFESGNIVVKMIPSQIGLGLITSMYTGLISDTKVALIYGSKIEEIGFNLISFIKNFPKFREEQHLDPNTKLIILTAPAFIQMLVGCEQITDLSFVGALMGAGSKMSCEEIEQLNALGRLKGLTVDIHNAYGQNELAGGVSFNARSYNKNGSAGIPAIGTNLRIVDADTLEDMPASKEGLIVEQSNSQFLMYDKMPERTDDAFVTLPDSTKWFKTSDIGYMDEEGFVFVTGRIINFATRYSAKISLEVIEKKLKTLPYVKDCGLIVSEYGGAHEPIVLFVCLNEFIPNLKEQILSEQILSDLEIFDDFLIMDELPYLSSGKIDYQKLRTIYKGKEDRSRIKK